MYYECGGAGSEKKSPSIKKKNNKATHLKTFVAGWREWVEEMEGNGIQEGEGRDAARWKKSKSVIFQASVSSCCLFEINQAKSNAGVLRFYIFFVPFVCE